MPDVGRRFWGPFAIGNFGCNGRLYIAGIDDGHDGGIVQQSSLGPLRDHDLEASLRFMSSTIVLNSVVFWRRMQGFRCHCWVAKVFRRAVIAGSRY